MAKASLVVPRTAATNVHVVRKMMLSPKQAMLLSVSDDKAAPSSSSSSQKLTPFQIKVYMALCQVPKGRVTTYRYLATAIDCGSFQAVGQALRRNPHAPTIPCHRVVQSDGRIGGFFGHSTGNMIDKKVDLLRNEGVEFTEDGKVDPSCLFSFEE